MNDVENFKKILESPMFIFSLICFFIMAVILQDFSIIISLCLLDAGLYSFSYVIENSLKKSNDKKLIMLSIIILICLILLDCSFILKTYSEILAPKKLDDSAKTVKALFVCSIHLFIIWLKECYCAIEYYENTKICSTEERTNNKKFSLDDDITPILSIAEGVVTVLEQKHLEKFLMRDYVISVFLSFGDLSGRVKNISEEKLNIILTDILNFLELPVFVRLEIKYNSDKSTAGTYHNNNYERKIIINMEDYYSPSNVIAILCHECTHYFMEYHKLNWNDTELNEQRTDVVANLIGFNKIMLEGYREINSVKTSWNTKTTTTHKIGYISTQDCYDLKNFLELSRNEILQKQQVNKILQEIKNEIQHHIRTAKILYQQLEFIDIKKINISNPEKILKIQEILTQKENRNINHEILKYEEAMTKISNISQANKQKQSIYNLCSELISWITTLQKYHGGL